MVKAIRGIASPLGTLDSFNTVVESVTNKDGDGVKIRNRHNDEIGEGFVHMEGDNVILTGYVQDDAYAGDVADAGLSIGFSLGSQTKAREVDGIGYYKDVTITEVSLTPNPSNKGAKVTKAREEEKEKEENKMDENIINMLADAKAETKELKAQLDKAREANEEMQKTREAQTPVQDNEKTRTREALASLGDKMKEMPSNGFFKDMQREATAITNQGDLAVSNTLASITSKYAKKSGIFDSAFKARFAGMTLGEDGVTDTFLEGMFEAGDDKKRNQTVGTRSLLPKMAEAYLEMDKATVANANDSGALSEYVMSIIPNRVIQKIEYNMLYGKAEGTNGIYGLFTKHTTEWTKALEYDTAVKGSIYNGLRDAVAEASISDTVRIAMNAKTYASLRKEVGEDGHPIFEPLASRQAVAQALGADDIDIRVWIKDGDIAVWNPTEFVLTGNFTMENQVDFDLRYNVKQWLAEMLVAGSISGLNRSAVLTAKKATK